MAASSIASLRATRVQNCSRNHIVARASADRRNLLLAGGSAPLAAAAAAAWAPSAEAAEKFMLPVSQLSTFERVEQRAEVASRATEEIRKVITPADAPLAMRLVLNDAATFDYSTKTGGMDASIVLNPAEASRPENAGLADYVKKLGTAKAAVDAGNAKLGSGAISWSDMMVLGAKVAVQDGWKQIKIARAADPTGGETIAKAFGSEWDVKLGRIDSTDEAPKRALPASATPDEVKDFMLQLGAKPGVTPGPFTAKPPFWEKFSFIIYPAAQPDPKAAEDALAAGSSEYAAWKSKYDQDRRTITRTNYEVDFINTFTKLTSLGAKFDKDAYLHERPGVKLG